jgi:hypothetical protein
MVDGTVSTILGVHHRVQLPATACIYQTLRPLITFTQAGFETPSVVRLILGLIGVASLCVVLPPVSCSLLYHDPASPEWTALVIT